MSKGDLKSLGASSKGTIGNPDVSSGNSTVKNDNKTLPNSASIGGGNQISLSKNNIKFVKSQARRYSRCACKALQYGSLANMSLQWLKKEN